MERSGNFNKQQHKMKDITKDVHVKAVIQRLDESKRDNKKGHSEHAVVRSYYKKDNWYNTAYKPVCDSSAFLEQIQSVAESEQPVFIKVEIFSGKGLNNSKPISTVKIDVNPQEDTTGENKELLELKEKVAALGTTGGDDFKHQFELQLKEIEHQNAIANLKRDHQDELREKDRAIDKLNDEIAHYKEEVDDAVNELNGLVNKEKQENSIHIIGARVLEKFARTNTGFISAITDLKPEDLEKIWADKDKQEIEDKQPQGNSSFSFDDADEFADLDEEHKEGITAAIAFLKRLDKDEFVMVYQVLHLLNNEEGKLNVDMAKNFLSILQRLWKEAKENAKEKPESAAS